MRNLQNALNTLLPNIPEKLKVDGIVGRRTRGAIELLRTETQKVFARKGYVWRQDCNLVAIRMKTDLSYKFSNRFIDVGLITLGENETAFEMSTVAGLYGNGNVLSPNWIDGVFGVGVVKEGQYREAYQLNGAWWSGYPFLLQIADFEYYRDGNLDTTLDRGKVYKGKKGFNFHSWRGFVGNFVNNLSQGCMVTPPFVWEQNSNWFSDLSKLQKNKIDFTLLNQDDFVL